MSKWKLCRMAFGDEVFKFVDGDEVTIGRGFNNTITLSSLVVSRNHCKIIAKKEEVTITDLKSSNGIYVGTKKILPSIPYPITDGDIIGFGWMTGITDNISNTEKFIFKLVKEKSSLKDRLQFQNESEYESIKANLDNLTNNKVNSIEHFDDNKSSTLSNECQLKRKLSLNDKTSTRIKKEKTADSDILNVPPDSDDNCIKPTTLTIKKEMIEDHNDKNALKDKIINILSDSEDDFNKAEKIQEGKKETYMDVNASKNEFKCEIGNLEYEAFNIKQEYLEYDEDIIQIDSDSDIESEQWLSRLSQSSPVKLSTNQENDKPIISNRDGNSSYSQLDDVIFDNIDFFSPTEHNQISDTSEKTLETSIVNSVVCNNKQINNLSRLHKDDTFKSTKPLNIDTLDGTNYNDPSKLADKITESGLKNTELGKKIQIIEPIVHTTRKSRAEADRKSKDSKSKKENVVKNTVLLKEGREKSPKESTSKNKEETIQNSVKNSNSLKEERKRKLKEIASKDKEEPTQNSIKNTSNPSKPNVNVKITTSNRGAFLSDVIQASVKPLKRKDIENEEKDNGSTKHKVTKITRKSYSDSDTKDEINTDQRKRSKTNKSKTNKSQKSNKTLDPAAATVRNDKTIIEIEPVFSKPIRKVHPTPRKSKKSVRFSDTPIVQYFEIEPGNKLNKTSSVKTRLLDNVRQRPIFSLEKITLMNILRWNPQWLQEQLHYPDPPPILGHNNLPMAIFHSFDSHKQYVQLVGDLLLLEIWECLTQGFQKTSHENNKVLPLRLEYIPPVPNREDQYFGLVNFSVKIASPTPEAKHLPRVGEILMVDFGPENKRLKRFFFVHNVRPVSTIKNISVFSISLYATFTDTMKYLKRGDLILGTTLAYINKELLLFEAMECLAESPLCETILRPEPRHFQQEQLTLNIYSQWTNKLNPSQKKAVITVVSAALSNRPSVKMIQGPPGTGKSSVICAIVMTYFYDGGNKKRQNRNKILICATSNAAVDELVTRLLNIRQSLPKTERFRMVRVGRLEAMHARARDVSSQQLAGRDARAHADAPLGAARAQEISHLEAKMNMWKTAANDAKDPVRVAYCQDRANDTASRLALLRGNGSGGELRPDQLFQSERRIIECADIIVTTLSSASSHKMKGLRDRVSLCIVDEAGQAIEPETLIPLTLGVTHLALIGDPQQLPGFICSQRAKKHGLGESLFSRLTSTTEEWKEENPVILLNEQYRMHPEIADYPNRAFYDSKIQTMVSPQADLPIPSYCMLGICSGDKGQEGEYVGASGANAAEAWGVARVCAALAAAAGAGGRGGLSLALLTPYAAHRDLLRRCLRLLARRSGVEEEVEVSTVDSAQGQERDVVLVSLARSHGIGFLADAGRMNVMLTRARVALLVCLNPLALTNNNQWRSLVEDAQRRNLYTTLPSKICQVGLGEDISNEEILRCITRLKNRS